MEGGAAFVGEEWHSVEAMEDSPGPHAPSECDQSPLDARLRTDESRSGVQPHTDLTHSGERPIGIMPSGVRLHIDHMLSGAQLTGHTRSDVRLTGRMRTGVPLHTGGPRVWHGGENDGKIGEKDVKTGLNVAKIGSSAEEIGGGDTGLSTIAATISVAGHTITPHVTTPVTGYREPIPTPLQVVR